MILVFFTTVSNVNEGRLDGGSPVKYPRQDVQPIVRDFRALLFEVSIVLNNPKAAGHVDGVSNL